jgi:hypothetical protein
VRITLGGVLLGAGLGASVAYFTLEPTRMARLQSQLTETFPGLMSLAGIKKAEEAPPKEEAYSPPPPFPVGGVNAGTSSISGVPVEGNQLASSTAPVEAADAITEAAPTPTPTPVVAQKKPQSATSVRKKTRRVRTTRTKTTAAAKATPVPVRKKTVRTKSPAVAKTVPAAAPKSDLTGRYVSLELITGRSVQGIYQGKTATHHVLNVPGLGPLEYPIDNVKSVQSAE